MTDTDRETLIRNYEDAKANNAIEGLIMTEEEDALFMYMIDQKLDERECHKLFDAYENGQFQLPDEYSQAAE